MPDTTRHIDPMLLSAYLDDEVSGAERALVTGHVAECALCTGELETLRQSRDILSTLPSVPVPRPFYITEAMVRPESQSLSLGERLRRLLLPLGGVAATAMVLVFALLIWQTSEGVPDGGTDTASQDSTIAMSVEETEASRQVGDIPEEEQNAEQAADAAQAELEFPESAPGFDSAAETTESEAVQEADAPLATVEAGESAPADEDSTSAGAAAEAMTEEVTEEASEQPATRTLYIVGLLLSLLILIGVILAMHRRAGTGRRDA